MVERRRGRSAWKKWTAGFIDPGWLVRGGSQASVDWSGVAMQCDAMRCGIRCFVMGAAAVAASNQPQRGPTLG